jgi:pyruvate,orthophosphate dikinase
MSFGFSRDDIGGSCRIISNAKFCRKTVSVHRPLGVGELIKIGIERGRKTRPNLEVGICGEHGGEPKSVKFCHRVGMDYVSCSPFRVPIARLAAAQAVAEEKMKEIAFYTIKAKPRV